MIVKAAFLQDAKGNQSLSRLIVFITVMVALFFCGVVLYLGRKDVMIAATAVGIIFNSIATPSLVFLFKQKSTESKTEINETNANAPQ